MCSAVLSRSFHCLRHCLSLPFTAFHCLSPPFTTLTPPFTAVLLLRADFNHSCFPNCFVAFHGNVAEFRVIAPIKKGQECTITYTDLYLPRTVRQGKLRASHHFDCNCTRCDAASPSCLDNRISGFRCKASGCKGCVKVSTGTCGKCDARYDPNAMVAQAQAADATFNLSMKAHANKDYKEARRLLEGLVRPCLFLTFHGLCAAFLLDLPLPFPGFVTDVVTAFRWRSTLRHYGPSTR